MCKLKLKKKVILKKLMMKKELMDSLNIIKILNDIFWMHIFIVHTILHAKIKLNQALLMIINECKNGFEFKNDFNDV